MIELSIILPVYNERQTLPLLLSEWNDALKLLALDYEFVLCEDGSTDGTKDVLPQLQKQYPINLSQKTYRRGYGGAVIDGILAANGKWILCIDSDGQCEASDANQFWNNRQEGSVLIGWRKARKDVVTRKIMSGLFGMLFNLLFAKNTIHDPSAPFVLFQRPTIEPYIQTDLSKMKEGFWWGFVAMCLKRKIDISELPINHRLRAYGKTQVYKLSKLPSIAIRNIAGLISIRFCRP